MRAHMCACTVVPLYYEVATGSLGAQSTKFVLCFWLARFIPVSYPFHTPSKPFWPRRAFRPISAQGFRPVSVTYAHAPGRAHARMHRSTCRCGRACAHVRGRAHAGAHMYVLVRMHRRTRMCVWHPYHHRKGKPSSWSSRLLCVMYRKNYKEEDEGEQKQEGVRA